MISQGTQTGQRSKEEIKDIRSSKETTRGNVGPGYVRPV
jgi:hypothetical protein